MGAESSDDPAGSKKTFGDEWVARYVNPDGPGGDTINDGSRFAGSVVVAKGSSAPNLLGKFHDKTAIEADRTDTSCRGNVYFAWSRFTGNGGVGIYLVRSTDHGVTFSQPMKLTAGVHDVQLPEISITGNGHVYVTYGQFEDSGHQVDGVGVVKSTDCGKTFSRPATITNVAAMGLTDAQLGGGNARDCGDGVGTGCESGYTFFRADTGPRATADQADTNHEWVYVAYEAIVPGTEVDTGTTFGWADEQGAGGQSAVYYVRYDGAANTHTTPERISPIRDGQQLYPDLAVDDGVVHALWWDTRNDVNNDATSMLVRPPGNDADGNVGPSFDVFAATRPTDGGSWSSDVHLTDVHLQRPVGAVRGPDGPVRWRLPVDRFCRTARRSGRGRIGGTRSPAPTSARRRRTRPGRTCSSVGSTQVTASSPATRVRETAGSTRTSTATPRRSHRATDR